MQVPSALNIGKDKLRARPALAPGPLKDYLEGPSIYDLTSQKTQGYNWLLGAQELICISLMVKDSKQSFFFTYRLPAYVSSFRKRQ